MKNIEPETKRSFRELGNSIIAMGRAMTLSRDLLALGKLLKRVEIREDNLRALRPPLEAVRVFADGLRELDQALRKLLDDLTPIVGVDN